MRQERLKAQGKFAATPADDIPDTDKLPMLVEEVGEVARAMCDGVGRYAELVQVAALALAWLEGIEKKMETDS